MRKMMEGMHVSQKDNVSIKQEIQKMAEGMMRTNEKQEIARVAVEAGLAKLSALLMASEERTSAAVRDVEGRLAQDVEQRLLTVTQHRSKARCM
eukprot:NODE_7815_length_419_cov_1.098901.p2 GENE.NODE_7815_length_419_cov_1.098901~~NODE_7815_length_419_cov_1.098901.p2  ORF type:complete len:94 (-),score=20.94 NODE_7815_length_419_cov_1.098901:32-313(-)